MAEIIGKMWDETIAGTTGADIISGGGGEDIINASEGNDIIYGDAPELTNVSDPLGNLFLTNLTPNGPQSPLDSGIPGNLLPTIQPLGGNDFITSGPGSDYISGGEGYDTDYEVAGINTRVTDAEGNPLSKAVLTNGQIDWGTGTGHDVDDINDIERVIVQADPSGGFNADYNAKSVTTYQVALLGGSGNDTLRGGSNTDILSGGGGKDSLSGGKGVDILQGGSGRDTIYGGGGEDIFYEYVDDTVNGLGGSAVLIDIQNVNDPGNGSGDNSDDNAFADGVYTRVATSSLGLDRLYSVENIYLKGGNGDNLFSATQFWRGNTTLEGGKGNDTLLGGNRLDTILGGIGNDSIQGIADNDLLLAGVGNDTVSGGTEKDFIVGDLGNDSLFGDSESDTLSGGEGDDTIIGSSQTVSVVGDEDLPNYGQVTVDGVPDGVIDALREDSDQDYTIGYNPTEAYHTMEGFVPSTINPSETTTTGQDILVDIERLELIGGESRNQIDTAQFAGTAAGKQTVLSGLENRDIIIGGVAADTINGGGDKDDLSGGAGNDFIDGFGSNLIGAYLDYPDGTNISGYVPGSSNEVVSNSFAGPQGILNVDFDADTQRDRQDTLKGGNGNDTLIGRDRADELHGDKGNDLLMGDDGFDLAGDVQAPIQKYKGVFLTGLTSLFGRQSAQPGNDTLSGNEGNDTAYGEQGNDSLVGGEANDWLYGGSADDTLYGDDEENTDEAVPKAGIKNDRLFGGTGYDSLIGGRGDDILNGDAGSDTLYGDFRNDVDGTSLDITDTNSNDSLFGGAGADLIFGGAGNDTLNEGGITNAFLANFTIFVPGLVGDARNGLVKDTTDGDVGDQLFGGVGSDFLSADDPEDILDAGTGSDTIVAFQGPTGVGNSLIGGDGNDVLIGGVAADNLNGGIGNDNLIGQGGNDILNGGDGNDTANGGVGDDILNGENGNDNLFGGAGVDTLYGGDGNDVLDGGGFDGVADSLVGGKGADILTGSGDGDTLVGGWGSDTINVPGINNYVVFDNGSPLNTAGGAAAGIDTVNLLDPSSEQLVLAASTFVGIAQGGGIDYIQNPTFNGDGTVQLPLDGGGNPLVDGAFITGTTNADGILGNADDDDNLLRYYSSPTAIDGVEFAVITNVPVLSANDFLVI